jgi:ABC-type cobalamin/Fe3+-siderophores transport system ATPase subunit
MLRHPSAFVRSVAQTPPQQADRAPAVADADVEGRMAVQHPTEQQGGERNRLHLAMTLKEEGNVLLLDEPTNDLDINTLRALEEGLENFAGCAVVISHDRWFLDRICTHILAFEGNSEVYYFEGGFSDLIAVMKAHNSFFRKLPRRIKVRREQQKRVVNSKPKGFYSKSVLFDYFIKRKIKFSDLDQNSIS